MKAAVAQACKVVAVTAEVEWGIEEILDATLSTTALVSNITRTIGEQLLASKRSDIRLRWLPVCRKGIVG